MMKISILLLLMGCNPGTWLDFVRGEEQVAERLIEDELGHPPPPPPAKPAVTVNQ